MRFTKEAAKKLAEAAISVRPAEIGCDDCAAKLEVLAEHVLQAEDVPEALQLVEEHLRRCPECTEEFEALLAGLRELERMNGD